MKDVHGMQTNSSLWQVTRTSKEVADMWEIMAHWNQEGKKPNIELAHIDKELLEVFALLSSWYCFKLLFSKEQA